MERRKLLCNVIVEQYLGQLIPQQLFYRNLLEQKIRSFRIVELAEIDYSKQPIARKGGFGYRARYTRLRFRPVPMPDNRAFNYSRP